MQLNNRDIYHKKGYDSYIQIESLNERSIYYHICFGKIFITSNSKDNKLK